ncbi:hypothetical protein [Pseudooceanicola sp. HF7]|uniref:hypothetical protein n=1 Tax=Pseudooceanicola sp. HF7 TaxID=2721560 RepID=UPI001C37DFED|nr:hypothetical protein [Pseudooceanicola sp. HF7]
MIAAGGWEGVRHNHSVSVVSNERFETPRRSFSFVKPKAFSAIEFGDYVNLAKMDGLVEGDSENPPGAYSAEWETIRLTLKGWRFLEEQGGSFWNTAFRQVLQNIPTIIVSVAGALLARWLLKLVGLV